MDRIKKAIDDNNIRKLRRLIRERRNNRFWTEWKEDVFFHAINYGSYEIVEEIGHITNLNVATLEDKEGRIPLHHAVQRGYEGLCKYFLGRKADPNRKDRPRNPSKVPQSSFQLACELEDPVIVHLLALHGGDPNDVIDELKRKHNHQLLSIVTEKKRMAEQNSDSLKLEEKVENMNGRLIKQEEAIEKLTMIQEDIREIKHSVSRENMDDKKSGGYTYVKFDKLQERVLTEDEFEIIRESWVSIKNSLKDREVVQEIGDRMYGHKGLTFDQLEKLSELCSAKYILFNVILGGRKITSLIAFIKALKEIERVDLIPEAFLNYDEECLTTL